MKKIAFSLIICFTAIISSFAQTDHRFSLGLGQFSHAYVDEMTNELFTDVDYYYPGPDDHGTYEYTEESLRSFPLTLNFHYEATLGKHFGIGVCFGYDYLRMHQETETIFSTGEAQRPNGDTYTTWDRSYDFGTLRRHIFFVMPEASVYWFKRNHVAMYSKLGLGMKFVAESRDFDSDRRDIMEFKNKGFYCQVSPVCVEFGGQKWRGFVELGYGAQGIAQYGVKYTIKGKEKSTAEEE
ncbi:MAG: hypothetical protein J6W13_12395 [Salinivirgaceae bacterium]|nr:hypothetical protein [Salinivirgaceae bacterium]